MISWRQINPLQRQLGNTLLGLALDGNCLEGTMVRRTNGSVEVHHPFRASLSLDPLTNDPELVGREIRKILDASGITERRCAVCIPLTWALTLTIKVPDLPEADIQSFLQIEAERNFPYAPDALMVAQSRYRSPGGEAYATLFAVPRDHVVRLAAVVKAAKLRPVTFSLGMTALPGTITESTAGVLVLVTGETSVGLAVSCGGGLAVLRTIEGAWELEGGERRIQADQVARETRITMGQLPADVRDSVRSLRILGSGDAAEELAEKLRPRLESLGIQTERVTGYGPEDAKVRLPAGTAVSPALSLAVRQLDGRGSVGEFLPPTVSAWQQFTARYSSRRLVWCGATAGAVALLVALVFLAQQWQLARWTSRWNALAPRVTRLETLQQNIRTFRPWFDESFRSLSILRRLAEAFPEDGAVTAKTVQIHELATVTCSGTARDHKAFLRTLEKLRGIKEISGVQVESIRGTSPQQFSFNFQWSDTGKP